ncbi:MAG: hypothetical protein L6Q57_06205, partial [Alphaproteobacteria bacterium]|nr:hypothetical protein [Alphaproteobacteria bacterium]
VILLSVYAFFAFISAAHADGRTRFCQVVVEHQPAPDVAYQPGVDVSGNPVVSADVVPASVQNQPIEIPITIDFAQQLNLPQDMEMSGRVAALTVYPDGKVAYNGHMLEPTTQTLCANALPANDGQNTLDPVISPSDHNPLDNVLQKAISNDSGSEQKPEQGTSLENSDQPSPR